ncbi:carbon storage regulator, CsrA [Singulisphaera sp. GP187]|uniref:carbon storage regulator n=1 Tax=Singulisphaera sp. GP187 TaxID=1882752 RepID=UPI00092C0747|nr:carbon storage regulator [Singulisphaera sp. GP187]SIN86154.1 carbon storage regulator, CsrA [Singulisphaera sp. GP187]
MLVLSRKLGQRVKVGQDVRITIVKIDRNSVRIGIEAPNDVTVYREEIVPLELDLAFDFDLDLDEDQEPAHEHEPSLNADVA